MIHMVNIIFLKYVIIWIVRHNIFDIAFQYITELVNGIDFNILIVLIGLVGNGSCDNECKGHIG